MGQNLMTEFQQTKIREIKEKLRIYVIRHVKIINVISVNSEKFTVKWEKASKKLIVKL